MAPRAGRSASQDQTRRRRRTESGLGAAFEQPARSAYRPASEQAKQCHPRDPPGFHQGGIINEFVLMAGGSLRRMKSRFALMSRTMAGLTAMMASAALRSAS